MNDLRFVKGMRELALALEQLPTKVQNNAMRGAMRAGAKVMAQEARSSAQFIDRSGLLRKTINYTSGVRFGVVKAYVTAGKKRSKQRRAFYAHMVEFGTAAHRLKGGTHPGSRPKPFMRPTLDHKAQAAIVAVREYMRERLATQHGIDIPGPDNLDDLDA